MSNPNYKFYAIAEDAEKVATYASEIAALFREATQDGINAYREQIIRRNTTVVEQGMRRLREELKPRRPRTYDEAVEEHLRGN